MLLDGVLSGARSARGRLVVVSGEAGVGKSRVVRETAAEARAQGTTVLWGRAAPGGGALRAVAEAVLAWGRGTASDEIGSGPFRFASERFAAGERGAR